LLELNVFQHLHLDRSVIKAFLYHSIFVYIYVRMHVAPIHKGTKISKLFTAPQGADQHLK